MAAGNIETKIEDYSHPTNFFDGLHSVWESRQFCDLTLKLGSCEFKAHKVVLVSCCQYFQDMFNGDFFIESSKNYIELFEVNGKAFEVILNYFYTGKIILSQNTVVQILRTSDFLGLKAVKSLCCEYLSENIELNNCVRRYSLAVTFDFETLKGATKSFIMQQLDKVSKMPEFLEMNKDNIKELFSNKTNAKAREMYKATMNWIKHDLENRKHLLPELIELIPAAEISYDFYIINMKNEELLRRDVKCTNWLLDNFIERFATENHGSSCNDASIFITALTNNNPICYQFKPESDELINLPPRWNFNRFSLVSYKNCIYLVTGERNKENIKSSFRYDTDECKWSEIYFNFERCNSGSCILRDQLYIIGGYDISEKSYLESCVCYDFNSEHKCTMASMKRKRKIPGVDVYENSIYVCCGVENNEELSCIERYDPREGIWYDAGKYNVAKGFGPSTVISSSFYTSILDKEIVERFDFRNNNSVELAKPTNGKNGGWITSLNGKLFRAHRKGLSEYDVNNDRWLAKLCEFDLSYPTVVSWKST